jgi:hypothetical protein
MKVRALRRGTLQPVAHGPVSRELCGAWIVNVGWEMAQAPLHARWDRSGPRLVSAFARASATRASWSHSGWWVRTSLGLRIGFVAPVPRIVALALLGGLISVGLERTALSAGRWAYGSAMPVIPGLGVGLTPVLQMALLPSLILRFAGSRAARV